MIRTVTISNYRAFESFTLNCNDTLNIIVGDNESGKSTILEAITLVLTKKLNGKAIDSELSPYLFNEKCVAKYIAGLKAGQKPAPPSIVIELFLKEDDALQEFRGSNNSEATDCIGLKLEIAFNDEYAPEYATLLASPHDVDLIPVEYYKASWLSFANNSVTPRSLPIQASHIDATTIRLQSGTDYYLHNIINNGLPPKARVGLAMAYRRLKEHFSREQSIKDINTALGTRSAALTDKKLEVGIDLSQKGSWETSLTPHLDNIPFEFIGKGEQNALKIMLALDRKAEESHIVLLEEPENHLSFTSMNVLIDKVSKKCDGKQIFATTHSAYVLNKLGIDKVILLFDRKTMSLTKLPVDTQEYFRKLSGYDTLRLILAKRTILVEGPSDELLVQKAYLLRHGTLPIQAGVDVVNVRGLSFARFLDIAKELGIPTAVITDNDGDHATKVAAKYLPYAPFQHIKVYADTNDALPTLEPQIVACNDLALLNKILGTAHADAPAMIKYMIDNKTDCALKLFDTQEPIRIPAYVWEAVA